MTRLTWNANREENFCQHFQLQRYEIIYRDIFKDWKIINFIVVIVLSLILFL